MQEELEVEERMNAGMGGGGSTSPSARMFRAREIRKLGEWRRQV